MIMRGQPFRALLDNEVPIGAWILITDVRYSRRGPLIHDYHDVVHNEVDWGLWLIESARWGVRH